MRPREIRVDREQTRLGDDAIVLVENLHRHYAAEPDAPGAEATMRAVGEVGSPTALATLTVVLSFLPMLFVTGMMGPYMRPIPINVPIAMAASLFIAFAITPWAAYRVLSMKTRSGQREGVRWVKPFRRALAYLLDHPSAKRMFLASLGLALAVSVALPVLKLVQYRMLPDANETSFVVTIDAPPDSTVGNTERTANAMGTAVARVPEVRSYQTFVGTHSVPTLASLLHGTVIRPAPNLADVQVVRGLGERE